MKKHGPRWVCTHAGQGKIKHRMKFVRRHPRYPKVSMFQCANGKCPYVVYYDMERQVQV